jgi:hypothetical protein
MMDYSLLIGVHDSEKSNDLNENFVVTPPPNVTDSGNKSINIDNQPGRPESDDNFSPTEDTEDTDDDQLNCKTMRNLYKLRNIELNPSQETLGLDILNSCVKKKRMKIRPTLKNGRKSCF